MRQQKPRSTRPVSISRSSRSVAQPAAGHEPSSNLLVCHAAAPLDARELHIVTGAEIVDVRDNAAGLQHTDCRVKRIGVSARDDDLVYALSLRPIQNLLGKIAVL